VFAPLASAITRIAVAVKPGLRGATEVRTRYPGGRLTWPYFFRNFKDASECRLGEESAWTSRVDSRPSAETERTH